MKFEAPLTQPKTRTVQLDGRIVVIKLLDRQAGVIKQVLACDAGFDIVIEGAICNAAILENNTESAIRVSMVGIMWVLL